MHEIGHNLNLRHAADGTDDYGDESGVMGYSYAESPFQRRQLPSCASYSVCWCRGRGGRGGVLCGVGVSCRV